jgi:hypothetical protein
MDGLFFFEGDLIFVDDDENVFERFDQFDKGGKLIAMKDRVVVLRREAFASLFHPVDGGEPGNDKDMFRFHGIDESKHGAGFARLRQGHGQDTENVGIEKEISDLLTELALIGKHSLKIVR